MWVYIMRKLIIWFIKACFLSLYIFVAIACKNNTKENVDPEVPLFDNLGDYHYPVSTNNELAQRYFNQGLILSFGFNHAQAQRAFEAAYQIDPDCAMCYWGAALVMGPNINAPMNPELSPQAYGLVRQGKKLSKQVTAKEQALIQALSHRYAATQQQDRSALDQEYADAMADTAAKYPNDALILALYAESLMDLHPWDFWDHEGNSQPWTGEIVATLEQALSLDADNPLANHLYIHVMEASPEADKALASAKRLPGLAPGSGHLVHMPAHIYIRLGMYHDAVKANQAAVKTDQNYINHQHTESLYTQAYIPHNHHFLWSAGLKTGRKDLAMQAALETAAHVDTDLLRTPGYAGTLQHFLIIPLYTLTVFGEWDQLLAEPAPDQDLVYPKAIWHYARGLAWLRKGDENLAQQELKQLQHLINDPSVQTLKIFDINSVKTLMQISADILQAEIALHNQDYQKAEQLLSHAIQLEDSLNYTEPKDWYLPPRQVLGMVFLAQGEPDLAEQVYREDLLIHPQNGWSLFGLMQSLRAQGKSTEAEIVEIQFNQVWDEADIVLTGSRF